MNVPENNGFAALRPTQIGDVVVMLATETSKLPPEMTGYLQALQNVVMGYPPEMIHVTLQRFGSGTPTKAKKLLKALSKLKTSLLSFEVIANDYLPVYSDFRDIHLLKWVVPESDPLRRWYEIVDDIGRETGMEPLYLRQGNGAWVTALLEIDPSNSQALHFIPIIRPLFRVNRLVISRLMEHGGFEFEGEFLF